MSAARRESVKQAEKVLRRLLRTPKTRDGLIAAVRSKEISKNFVFGFISAGVREGLITTLKSSRPLMYQLSECIAERPCPGIYPAWLEPRSLPDSTARRIFIDGLPVGTYNSAKEE